MTIVKSLDELLGHWLSDSDLADTAISGLSIDSRRVVKGDLFFAYPGGTSDGRDYIDDAVDRGACLVVYEADGCATPPKASVPVVPLHALREKVGVIAERFFDNPGKDLFIVGITGTNGKTSCAHLLAQAFSNLGINSGLIGTLGWGFVGDLHRNPLTTPDPVSLHHMLQQLRIQGATHVCMEVSSHALAQGRVSGVCFDAALFTNLSHDHLDYHDNLQDYADAKAQLFDSTTLRFAVINGDDEFGRNLVGRVRAPTWTFGLDRGEVRASEIKTGVAGLNLVLQSPAGSIDTHAQLIGRLNVHNVLAVAAVLLADGSSTVKVAQAIDRLHPVPGRMELFQKGRSFEPSVVVDYAHTPDALERALTSVREHCLGRVWCVFGCGGDRDRAKRPIMGAIAERLADEVVVTDDNPRHETARSITDQIVAGMTRAPRVINDRVRAIEWAIERADTDDWVLVAGKGHETTQQVGDSFLEMDDRSIVSECLGVAA
ncbi:MAG: UDP-N-acetylmuramoyl-L-alanyl-D-glutamate--2,6-diaminopimelate ligase [Arenicellales bacterium]|nr:UDP-N-acetylmuramoyl-L-alanyl-D-glutamate--2,6-diaminopimelate ligase [Arenicellales bacterium]